MPNHVSSDTKDKLYVFKASAGSGKTHRLTEEYLSLLFSDPMAYRHILAVTFTNKATDEMKSRIIEELAHLAKGEKSPYVDTLARKYSMNEMQVRKEAKDVLIRILHDYSAFSVSTIDRFFQQAMRAFVREIGLNGGYNVELDTEKVLTKAIDTLLYDLERTDSKLLLDWLIRFSEEKIENGETWNIKHDIQALSFEIFKESYKAYSNQVQENIQNKELMTEYKDMLFSMIAIFENQSKQLGIKALNIMDRYGLLPEDFKGTGRSPFKSFVKWANGEVAEPTNSFRKLADNLEQWYTKTSEARNRIEESYAELNECVNDIIRHYDNSRAYQTAKEINRYFFALGILGDVDKKIREYAAENNIMLISDTTELLNRIIDGNESPFIYEKIGTRIDHYMIDEFQDTSGMQWMNFRPLVQDSLADGEINFIVGDVKQSIYRWRNSDWKLLDSQLDKDFETLGVNHETLDTNWRSGYNIVNFNNTVFSLGSHLLQETYNNDFSDDLADISRQNYSSRITDAYSDPHQYIPDAHKTNSGHVKVQFVDMDEHESLQEYVLKQLPTQIEELQDRGYRLKDIAILVRTKKEGAEVANKLLSYKMEATDSKYKYDIISDESLYISNSKSIKLMVSLLKYLRTPHDLSLKALAVYEYFRYNDNLEAQDALKKYFSENEELPPEIESKLEEIRELALYEMTEALFEMFTNALNDDEQVYIQAFLDIVLDYTIKYSSDLNSFLKWWDESGSKKTIFTPDGQDAIRIMTIHKSKGLGFEAVILPFCDWGIDHRMPVILWCKPKMAPFNQLHLVPVKYSKRLSNTIFEEEYYEEKLHAYIDNINVLYVALTRAKKDLIIYAPLPKKDDINSISTLLWRCITTPSVDDTTVDLSQHYNEERNLYETGANYRMQQKEEHSEAEEILITQLPSISFDDRLKLQLNNKHFFTDSGLRDYGTLMHEVVSSINTIDDIESATEKYYISGDITLEQKVELIELLNIFLAREDVAEWYCGGYKVLNEIQILQAGGKFVRPDRVMIKGDQAIVIDYKFGEKEDRKYIKQVKNYANLIQKIGYKDVKGYICYVRLNKVVEV